MPKLEGREWEPEAMEVEHPRHRDRTKGGGLKDTSRRGNSKSNGCKPTQHLIYPVKPGRRGPSSNSAPGSNGMSLRSPLSR